MQGFESLRGRERAVVIAFTVIIFVDVLSVISTAAELSLLGQIERGDFVSDAAIDANDSRQAAIAGIWLLLLIICAVVFIRWLRTAFRNVDVLAPGLRRHGQGWATGGWFVPFLNLVRPKQITDDTYRAGADSHDVSLLLHVWWGAWIVTNVVGQIAARRSLDAEDIDHWQTTSTLYLASDATDAIAAGLAILVVRLITRLQHERAEAIASAPPPQPAPMAWAESASIPPPGWESSPERPVPPG